MRDSCSNLLFIWQQHPAFSFTEMLWFSIVAKFWMFVVLVTDLPVDKQQLVTDLPNENYSVSERKGDL